MEIPALEENSNLLGSECNRWAVFDPQESDHFSVFAYPGVITTARLILGLNRAVYLQYSRIRNVKGVSGKETHTLWTKLKRISVGNNGRPSTQFSHLAGALKL